MHKNRLVVKHSHRPLILFPLSHIENPTSTAETSPKRRRDSEFRDQVLRLRPGGRLRTLVELLTKDFFIPLMNAYSHLGDDDVDFNATCDQYDPLKNEPQSIIDMHFVSFDKYVLWLKNREAKLLHKESNVLQQDAPPIPTHAQIQIQNELRYFLDKQTVDKVLIKVYIIFSQDQTPLRGASLASRIVSGS